MGCGPSSDTTGRDSTTTSGPKAEAFFPSPTAAPTNKAQEVTERKAPAIAPEASPKKEQQQQPMATSDGSSKPKKKPSSQDRKSADSKKKKKKSTYVPPAPIIAPPPMTAKAEKPPPPPVDDDDEASLGAVDMLNEDKGRAKDPDPMASVNFENNDAFETAALEEVLDAIPDEPTAEFSPPRPASPKHYLPKQKMPSELATPEPSSASGMRFDELYRLKGVLGSGAFSTVREGFHKCNRDYSYAVKCINRKKLSEEDEAALLDEVAILKEMKHLHIIRLYDFFVEPSTYYLVMERMRGGELFDRIVAKAYYNEKEARDTCKIILEAVEYCHRNHVAHRDLKPENLLLLSDEDDSAVKIADFGFAKKVKEPNSLKTQCGTPGYVAPEILEGTPYDERADMWSVGVILYILLGGYPPFIESTQRDLFRKIRKGEYEFHEEYWGTVSSEAKDLISSLLTVDYNDRLSAVDALENPWIMGDDARLANKSLANNLEKLRSFNAKRKFRAAVSTIMAINKLNSLGQAMSQGFVKTQSMESQA